MEHDKVERIAISQHANDDPPGAGEIDPTDTIIQQASAEQYARRGKVKSDFQQVNRWIAVSLYLILAGMALVIF